ncbi:MAG: serine hydrolase [Opitutaceae bacterium]|nr:serine hydrolase [Opitutaceae bacterium]
MPSHPRLLLTLFLASLGLHAQTPSITGPALPGTERFDAAVLDLMMRFNSPGAQFALSLNGRLMMARGYGLADRESGAPVQPDSLFRIASNSKPITALAILTLVEQGRLTLDQKVFPILGLTPLPGATNLDARLQDITVRHLLHHTGGWDSAITPDQTHQTTVIATAAGMAPPADIDSIIRFHLGRRLDFAPGARYAYANIGYMILGRLIEKVTGQNYAAYVRTQIFAKAGITRAFAGGSLLADRLPGEVRYYDYADAPLVPSIFPPLTNRVSAPYGQVSLENIIATGGWVMSAVDYVRLLCALDGTKPGPATILTPASVELWTSPPPAPVSTVVGQFYYAMGVDVRNIGNGVGARATWRHNGSLPGARAFMTRMASGVSYAITFNTRIQALETMFQTISDTLSPIVAAWVPPSAGDLFVTARPAIAGLASRNVSAGATATFASGITSVTSPTYQWHKDGVPLTGATGATLTVPSVTAASAGNYHLVVTNTAGSTASDPATLSVGPAVSSGRLVNLSILTGLADSADSMTMGYVVGGAGTVGAKPLLVRAAGPSLGALGVPGTLVDPKLELFAGATKTGENDNWGGVPALANAMTAVGAFAYVNAASRDAAAVATITSRDNSVKVSGTGGGAVIAELYDATPDAHFTATTPRLVNLSVMKQLGTGLSAGFVVGGTTPVKLLIRAVGPGLAAFGLGGTVADPQLSLFAGSTKIGESNDWGGTAELSAAFNQVGAFALPAASKDAALLVTLSAGNYSVQVAGVGGTGLALVEVYEVP